MLTAFLINHSKDESSCLQALFSFRVSVHFCGLSLLWAVFFAPWGFSKVFWFSFLKKYNLEIPYLISFRSGAHISTLPRFSRASWLCNIKAFIDFLCRLVGNNYMGCWLWVTGWNIFCINSHRWEKVGSISAVSRVWSLILSAGSFCLVIHFGSFFLVIQPKKRRVSLNLKSPWAERSD